MDASRNDRINDVVLLCLRCTNVSRPSQQHKKKNEKPNIEEIWRNFSKTFSLADTINFRRRRIFTKKKRGIIKRKESLFLLLPFMTRNIDADFSWGSLNIGLDDGGEILEDEPERIAGNSNVPATFKNRSNLI